MGLKENCQVLRAKPDSLCVIWRDAMLKLFRGILNNKNATKCLQNCSFLRIFMCKKFY